MPSLARLRQLEVGYKTGELAGKGKFGQVHRDFKNPSFSENILKFEKPRKTTLGIDVKNMYAKFGVPTMIGSGSKIGGTEMSGEQEQRQETTPTCKIRQFQTVTKSEPNGISTFCFRHCDRHGEISAYPRFQTTGTSGSSLLRLAKMSYSATLIYSNTLSSAPKFFGGAAPAFAVAG